MCSIGPPSSALINFWIRQSIFLLWPLCSEISLALQEEWQVVFQCIAFLFLVSCRKSGLHLLSNYDSHSKISPQIFRQRLVGKTVFSACFLLFTAISITIFECHWPHGCSLQGSYGLSECCKLLRLANFQHALLCLRAPIPLPACPNSDRVL